MIKTDEKKGYLLVEERSGSTEICLSGGEGAYQGVGVTCEKSLGVTHRHGFLDGDNRQVTRLERREISRIQHKLLSISFVGTSHAPVNGIYAVRFHGFRVDIEALAVD